MTVTKDELINLIDFCLSEGYLTVFDGEEPLIGDDEKAEIIADNFIANRELNDGIERE